MPRTAAPSIQGIDLPDLTYAVGRLVEMGRTTAAEVAQLARDRSERIAQIEAELRALKAAQIIPLPAARPAKAKPAKAKAAAPPAKSKFTMTPKMVEFRKTQGRYMGLLRNFSGATRTRIKGTAKAKGIPAGVAEMKKLLARKGAPNKAAVRAAPPKRQAAKKTAPATKPKTTAKQVTTKAAPAKRKPKQMPASKDRTFNRHWSCNCAEAGHI
jgi:hypothetical protein